MSQLVKKRHWHGGTKPRPMAERFWEKVSPCPITGCWWWTGPAYAHGYGSFALDGTRSTRPNRVAMMLSGVTLHPGDCVCHRCDQPACVNPAHLFVGTNLDNIRDRDAKGRKARGSKIGRALLTESDVRAIRLRLANRETQEAVARAFGVTQTAISSIVCRRTWAWVTP